MSVNSTSRSPRNTAVAAIIVTALASVYPLQAYAGCWSVIKSPKWADVQASLASAKLCEVLPEGPNRTRSLSISVFDICDAPGGIRLHAEASVECKTSDAAVFQVEASASATADFSVDIGTCKVTESNVTLGGAFGGTLSERPEFQELIKQLAQSKLTELCGQ